MDAAEFKEQDREWRRRLLGLSLIAEAAIDVDAATAALRILSQKVFAIDDRPTRSSLMKRYSATALAGLTAVASAKYEEGTFWPRVSEVAGFELIQPLQQLYADTFRYGLDLLGLARFNTPLRNLGEILMHAGIPLASVGAFMQILQRRDAAAQDLTGIDFCAWAASMSRAGAAAKGLDAPSWRFLSDGGDVASDFVDRFLTILDATTSGLAPSDLSMDSLPEHIADEVRRLLVTGAVQRNKLRTRARESRLVPRLVYVDGMIQIYLPPFEDQWRKDVTWQITVAGESWSRTATAPWPGDPVVLTFESIRRPQLNAVVQLKEEPGEWTVPIVETASPLLVFDPSTRAAIPLSAQLPKGRVWVAFPNESDIEVIDALEFDGELGVIEQVDAPYGWDDWSFALIDLRSVNRLRVRGGEGASAYRWRYISSVTRPALEDMIVVPFVRTLEGRPVVSARPRVVLPAARQDEETGLSSTSWTIVTSTSSGEELSTHRVDSAIDPSFFDPWPADVERLVGEFRLQVRGPLGRGAVLDVAIAEQILVRAEPEFRWFESMGGLESCALSIRTEGTDETIDLLPDMTVQQIVLHGPSGMPALSVNADVDHMWVSTVTPDGASQPAIGPARVHRENLAVTELRFNTIPRAFGRVVATAGSVEVQSVDLAANVTGIAKINLAGFTDTAIKHGVLTLRYEVAGRSTTLGVIRPKQLVTDVIFDADLITVETNGDSVPLELGIYLDFAPWREAESLEVPIGVDTVPLPSTVHGRGPAWVTARVLDPWARSTWPKYPLVKDENSRHLDLPVTAGSGIEHSVIAWVAGESPLPEGDDAFRFALSVYGSLRAARTDVPRWQLRKDVATRSRELDWEFVEAARESNWSRSTHTRLLVEGWAATGTAAGRPLNSTTWTLSPFLGLLESSRVEGTDRAGLEDIMATVLGDSARQTLVEGTDESASVGAFRGNAEILSDWSKERVDEVWSAVAPVPGALLNTDQRLIHARELFDSRVTPDARTLATTSRGILRRSHIVLQDELGERVRTLIRARSGGEGWPSLPCLSITLSLLARLAARGSSAAAQTFELYRSGFGDLAAAAPSFVEQDLVLAELWMTHWEMK